MRNFKYFLLFIIVGIFAGSAMADLRDKPTTMEEIDRVQKENNRRTNEWLNRLKIALLEGSIFDCENSKFLFYNGIVWLGNKGEENFYYPTSYSKKGETIKWVSSYATYEFYGDTSTLYRESNDARTGNFLSKNKCSLVKGSGAGIVRPQDEILAASKSNEIYVKFSDGTSQTYTNVKKMPSDAAINARIEKDFPGKKVLRVIKGKIYAAAHEKYDAEKNREAANLKLPFGLQTWMENGALFVGGKQVTDSNGKIIPGLKRFIDDTNISAKHLGVPSPFANISIPANYGVTAY